MNKDIVQNVVMDFVSFKNHFIKVYSTTTEEYLLYFFPFDELNFAKHGVKPSWSVSDLSMVALAMTMSDLSQTEHGIL